MPVQRPQHSRSIGTAATQACLGGDPLGDADLDTIRILSGGVKEQLRSLPCQIAFIGGDVFLIAQQLPGLACSDVDLNIVPQGDGLHDALNIMVAVGALAQNIQCQIQFGECAFVKCGHLIILPSK